MAVRNKNCLDSNPSNQVGVEWAKIVNLTPHPITICDDNCSPVLTLPPSGMVARVKQERRLAKVLQVIQRLDDEVTMDVVMVPVVEATYGEVEGLPGPKRGVVYVVSSVVLEALKGQRDDVVAPDTGPGSVCRDENGRIIGVRFLRRW